MINEAKTKQKKLCLKLIQTRKQCHIITSGILSGFRDVKFYSLFVYYECCTFYFLVSFLPSHIFSSLSLFFNRCPHTSAYMQLAAFKTCYPAEVVGCLDSGLFMCHLALWRLFDKKLKGKLLPEMILQGRLSLSSDIAVRLNIQITGKQWALGHVLGGSRSSVKHALLHPAKPRSPCWNLEGVPFACAVVCEENKESRKGKVWQQWKEGRKLRRKECRGRELWPVYKAYVSNNSKFIKLI